MAPEPDGSDTLKEAALITIHIQQHLDSENPEMGSG